MRSRKTFIHLLAMVVSTVVALLSLSLQAGPTSMVSNADPKLSGWGIENGCLNSGLVRHFYVLNAHAAVIELADGKRVLMRFSGDCQGVEQYGFVHTAHNNKLCVHSNTIRVLQIGTRCEVESLEPYP